MSILISMMIFLNSFFSFEYSHSVSSSLGYSIGKTSVGNYYQNSIFGSYENYYCSFTFAPKISKDFLETTNTNNYGNLRNDSINYFTGIHLGYIFGSISFGDFYLKPFSAIGIGVETKDYFYKDPYGISYDWNKKYMLEFDDENKFQYNIKIGSSLNYKFVGLNLEYNLNKKTEFGIVVHFNSEFWNVADHVYKEKGFKL